MSPNEKQELINRISGMSDEELILVASVIPVEYCLQRITDELNKGKQLAAQISSAVDSYSAY